MSSGVSFRDITGWLVCVVFGAAWIWLMPRFWRNERGVHSDTPHPYWPWGVRFWRAAVRTGPLAGTMFVAAAVLIPAVELVTDEVVRGIMMGVTAVVVVVIIVCGFTIILFNWPKRFVAPHHRHQRGLVAELVGKPSAPTPPPKILPAWQREGRRHAPSP